jgi:uncharacterized integral membrane protein
MDAYPTLEEQIALAHIKYGKRHDISYRAGFIMQVLGLGILAVLYPLESPFYTIGIMLFEAGALLAAVYLLVWMTWIKKVILGAIVVGIALQVAGFYAPEQHAGSIIIAGIGLVCAGAAGMAGKEAYCFAWREGWMLMWLYPIVIFANLFMNAGLVFNTLAFSALFILNLFLAGKKLKQPLLASCVSNVCGLPPEKKKS